MMNVVLLYLALCALPKVLWADNDDQIDLTCRYVAHHQLFSLSHLSPLCFRAMPMPDARLRNMARRKQDRTGQDRTGQDRTGQDRTGQDRTGQDRYV